MPVICTNIKLRAPAQFIYFDFNSFCEFNGVKIGVKNGGLYKVMCGDSDTVATFPVLIAGRIDAYFTIASSDFGYEGSKIARHGYVGFYSDGDIAITVSADERTAYTYTLDSHKSGLQHGRFTIGRGIYGRFWKSKIANVNGSDFSIDSYDLAFQPLNKAAK